MYYVNQCSSMGILALSGRITLDMILKLTLTAHLTKI